jgi:putative flippase GtrA
MMVGDRESTDRARALARHGAGFVASGLIALSVDALVLTILTSGLGLHPLVARLAAISCAMVAGWRAHRRLTFDVKHPPSLAEFLSYAAVAWFSAAVNYAGFAAVLLLRPATPPLVALVIASLGAMTVSYLGMRFGVFQDPADS